MEKLAENEVHVWRVPIATEKRSSFLSPDESKRAERFYFQKDKDSFSMCRSTLRVILARYLNRDPAKLQFGEGINGKPFLEDGDELRFNVSHSGGLALIAVTRDREVGVDVEQIRTDVDWDGISLRYFSEGENKALRQLPQSSRVKGFFTCWTRKEAFIKAKGKGLSYPLDQFEVSLEKGEGEVDLSIFGDTAENGKWSLRGLDVGEGYEAALVMEGKGCTLRFFDAL